MNELPPAPEMRPGSEDTERLRLVIRGAVQGVGFRPFVYRLATEMSLAGWVNNSSHGVFIEVEGKSEDLRSFISRIEKDKPPRSYIQSLESSYLDPVGFESFEIRPSELSGEKTALVMPDIATCPNCIRDMFDPVNRRYLYPFTNCTNCGPRFTIIEALPYDRANTTMKKFTMCPDCQGEYNDPLDRRFHAQPNACPACGPQIALWDIAGKTIAMRHEALQSACQAIRDGKVVAVKGIGGFHIMVDARNDDAVGRLRTLKEREEKPFALMYPALEMVKSDCLVSAVEERLLDSPESPIILLRKKAATDIAPSVAPANPYLGIMLPYSPLHHLMLAELGFPVVATSGNRSDEPICIDEIDALERLAGIADYFLVHDRPIARHVDDSIVRAIADRELVVRRARGYAPLPINVKDALPQVLAVGAHLKNTVAISRDHEVFISQHIGDLETSQAHDAFKNVIADLSNLFDINPRIVTSDLHPDYLSTKYARACGLPVTQVQHHYAHILAVMAENEISGDVLGVSWDGTGFGTDKTIWGGEFLTIDQTSFGRFAHLRTFRLPGGEKAITEPRRTALGLLYEIFGEEVFAMAEFLTRFTAAEIKVVHQMLTQRLNSPVTSSAGRLFDAVSSILGIRQISRYEGQAAMELEFAIESDHYAYPFGISKGKPPFIVDWEQTIRRAIYDYRRNVMPGIIAARFHNTLAEIIVEIARLSQHQKIVLSGGCFQNAYLTERAINRLRMADFRPYWHQRVPPNDGGIALGQVIAAGRNEGSR